MGLLDVAGLTDDQAHQELCKLRWPENDGEAVCPDCGCCESYKITTRQRFKCTACGKMYSVTSGTIFSGRKLSHRQLLLAIFLFANGAKGLPALELARTLNIHPKSAFVLLHKLREAIESARKDVMLEGIVEIDGAYFGGSTRPPNAGRSGKKVAGQAEEKPRKLCVIAMVERKGQAIPLIASSETRDAAMEAARRHIRPGSTVAADEHGAYNVLHSRYEMLRINHSEAYADGLACTNQAESFHSRMRRAEIGQYHHMSGVYLHRYAHEMAFRHSRRTSDNGSIYREMTGLALIHPVSREWKGYWQKRSV